MDAKLQKIQATLAAGDKAQAGKMLRWVLKHEPSADAWVMAADLTESPEQKIALARKALDINPLHTGANRLLQTLEGAKPLSDTAEVAEHKNEWQSKAGEKPFEEIKRQKKPDRFQRHAQRQRSWTRLGCICSVVFAISFSIAMFRAVGLVSSFMTGKIAVLLGRPTPVVEIQGTPLAKVEAAPFLMTPSLQEKAVHQDMEILDSGYMHEHFFNGVKGEEYAIYVQFLSLSANNVPRNVVLVDPTGFNASALCMSDRILKGGNNVALTCILDETGTWKIRIVGREGESVGTYFLGVEILDLN